MQRIFIRRAGYTNILNLSGRCTNHIPPEIWELTKLKQLDLSNNQIKFLPKEIGKLTKLTILNLQGNKLTSIPTEIGNLTQLQELRLYSNQLISLPSEIGKLINLTGLRLDNNQLKILLPEIGKLSKLTGLRLDKNQLISLPSTIEQLEQLRELWINNNHLTTLPSEIGKLPALEELRVEGNPISSELIRLAKDGKLISYLQELAKSVKSRLGAQILARPFNEAKLLLIGPGEVGKSWLLQALQGKKPVEMGATKGIEIARQPLDLPHPAGGGRRIHFNCWDFGGQDQYQITHQIFFSPKAIYLLVWKPRPGIDPDLTARLERIQLSAGRTAKVFIVSTHADDNISAVVGENAIFERFGDLIGGFLKVDSAAGPEGTGIAELKQSISKAAAGLEGMDDLFPDVWHQASTAMRQIEPPTLTFKKFAGICQEKGMEADSVESLANILDVQGHAVYFADAARSGKAGVSSDDNLVVRDPEWLAKAVAMVLEDKPTIEYSGVLEHTRLPLIWKKDSGRGCPGYEPCLCGYLLWMMWKFEIAYRLDTDKSLIPQLIERNQPDDLRWTPGQQSYEPQATLLGRIPHDPPSGLIPVFTAAVHPLRKIKPPEDPWDRNWRTGFFLDTARRGTAFVELRDRDVSMTVRDAYPAHLLRELRRTLDSAAKDRWKQLVIDYCVPCYGILDGKECTGSFKLSFIEPRRGQKVACQHCNNDEIEVDKLLDGYDVREEWMKKALHELRVGQQDLMALAMQMYHDVLDPAREELERAPCMISILPDKAGKWDLMDKATKQLYRVTCWCEHPDGPHPGAKIYSGNPPDYRFEMPKDWLVKAAPFISWFTMLAKTFLPVAGKVTDAALGGTLDVMLKKNLELMGDLAKALPSGKLELGKEDDLEIGLPHDRRPEIVALRHIHDALMAQVPEAKRWGDLRAVRTRAHGLLWLCPEHAAIQDPPVPHISETI